MSSVISDQMVHEVCKEAFRVCQKSNEKNRSCAGYIARELLVEKRFRREDAKDAGDRIDRILDQWFGEREDNLKFVPPEFEESIIETGKNNDELPILHS